MSQESSPGRSFQPRLLRFFFEYSLFLLGGSAIALVWANMDAHYGTQTYERFVHFELERIFENGARETDPRLDDTVAATPDRIGQPADGYHGHPLDIQWLVNDWLMALFFAIAAKEVWMAMLPGGALANRRKAATPLLATLGGVLGPTGVYLAGAWLTGTWTELGRGWAIPCATDIAFSYLIARLIFGPGHPAIAFLLLLAIADDAIGLVILAVFYPQGEVHPEWLLLTVAAVGLGIVFHRVLGLRSFWWYILIPGLLSWLSFWMANIHPALGLVPIIPTMPHAASAVGRAARRDGREDTLNEFEHWWDHPVELILGLFGLVNAGVVLANVGTGTWLVLSGLVIGKPLGVLFFVWIGQKLFGLEIPGGMGYRHVVAIGMIAGMGFTVALFVSSTAFRGAPGELLDSVKMGALISFVAGGLAFIMARWMGIRAGESLRE